MQSTTYSDLEVGAMVAEHGAAWITRIVLFVGITLVAGFFAVTAFVNGELALGLVRGGERKARRCSAGDSPY